MKLNLEKIKLPGLELKRPILIAGPCSAESEKQMLNTALGISRTVKIFRAGIWKPRTRPNSFEGVGSKGLVWLKKVKEETGMFTATEVANVKHVYEALKYGVDILWIGARTTANPFAVQEIADALKGVDIPVLVKNPVNPDLDLWIGAIERINQAGIKKLAAIHRGFSSYDKSKFRNNPQWQLPIELKRRIPELLIINDPSHISGKKELVHDIAQKAMDLNFDGLIIETHINPDEAKSDARQQLNPDELNSLIDNIILRNTEPAGNNGDSELDLLREQIDLYDNELMDILENRMNIVGKIGEFKLKKNVTILQSKRWNEIITKKIKEGNLKGLSDEFISLIFKGIHQESINLQTKILNKKNNK
ncbi:chorismate mutase [Bacteroidota bacterium]